MVGGGFAVVAVSFFVTMQFMDYWLRSSDPNASVIHVVEATYGQSCRDFTPPPGHANLVKAGNATIILAQACDSAKASCIFVVDDVKLSDPVMTQKFISFIYLSKRVADRRYSAVRRRKRLHTSRSIGPCVSRSCWQTWPEIGGTRGL
jgi:hypothetical protein